MTARVVVTRPRAQSVAIAAALEERGYEPLIEPMLDIVVTAEELPEMAQFGGLAFSSVNAVAAFAPRSAERGLPAYAVGRTTGLALEQAGFSEIREAAGNAEALGALIRATYGDPRPLLYVSGRDIAHELGPLVAPARIAIERIALYEAVAAERLSEALLEALYARTIASVLFFSARTAHIFGTVAQQAGLADMFGASSALCMSDAVARAARLLPWRSVQIAERPTADAMLALLPTTRTSGARHG